MLMAALGCAKEYRVQITDRCGGGAIADITDYSSLSWSRLLNDVGTAELILQPGCCDDLDKAHEWIHELVIYRDSQVVFQGPIVLITDCRGAAGILAMDMAGWLSVRLIHERHCWQPKCGGQPQDAVQVARALAADGFAPDDPCGLEYVRAVGGCRNIQRDYRAESDYVLDAIDDLAESVIDYTTVGRSIILMCKGRSLGRLDRLTCEHFMDDVCVSRDGRFAATRVVVEGDGVKGTAGGVDPFYGLIERLVEDDSIKDADAATDAARGIVAASKPPVLFIDAPQNSQLTPDAPVDIADLVPGVTIPVLIDCTCIGADENMRLTAVEVDYTQEKGEAVKITLESPTGEMVDTDGT